MQRHTATGHPRGMPGVVEFPCTATRLPNGNTLVADAGDDVRAGSEILEIDPAGQVVWRYGDGLLFAHSAFRLANGHTLVADTTNDRVIEVAPDGSLAFSTDDLGGGSGRLSDGSHLEYPNYARALDDGSLLVTDRNNDRVVIIDHDGRVLWCYGEQIRHPHNAEALPTGNVLIANSDGNTIVEVDREKQVVWTYGDGSPAMLHWPRHARRLADGNTLITDSKNGRVIEVTPAGETVWRYQVDYLSKFYYAEKLPNGNVLIGDQQHHQVIEVDPGGTVVWMFRNYVYPNPIFDRLRNGRFAERDDDGWPADWILVRRLSEGGGAVVWDDANRPRPCPGIAYDRDGAVWMQQTLRVAPGTTYHMSGKIRTEGLEGFACFQMAFLDALAAGMADGPDIARGQTLEGTTSWTGDVFQAEAPPGAAAVEVRLFVTGKGKAWVKDVVVTA